MIAENSFKIQNLSTMMYDFSPWMSMTLWPNGRKQRHMSIQIQSCVWEEYVNLQKQTPSGKNRFIISDNPASTQNCVELMENRLSSSGIFPRIHIN